MDSHNPLGSVLYFLIAAVIAVPLFSRLKLGQILGYLIAGLIIGPQCLNLIDDPQSVLHFSEIGVVLLLFVIGLELNPEKLWGMRDEIAGLGLGQLLFSAAFISSFVFMLMGDLHFALVIGLALGLSSTAFAIQLMAERNLMASPLGRKGFAILLLQDLAVIPILLLVQSFSDVPQTHAVPWWWGVTAVLALLVLGRFVLNPLLTVVSRYGSRASMTSASLLIVVGSAFVMLQAGLSMGMGAFIAGIMLANSHFRHQLHSDIEPFKGLTLGLFFMAIGMSLDLALFMQKPLILLALALLLMAFKAFVIAAMLRVSRVSWKQGFSLGLILSQGGEFAFVVMSQAMQGQILSEGITSHVNLIVGLSMALTSPLLLLLEYLARDKSQGEQAPVDIDLDGEPEVMIMGFGRFGQTAGRILAANCIAFTALDKDAEHIAFVRQMGNKVFFGDASRYDVLQTAGIEHTKVVLLAIDDAKLALKILLGLREHYPNIHVIARARNRADYRALKAAGAHAVIREVFKGSLDAVTEVLRAMGFSDGEALKTAEAFQIHDQFLLQDSMEYRDDMNKLIEISQRGRSDLERIFNQDVS